jgi:hypothetical protein
MKYFACFDKMDEQDEYIYNTRYSKRINVGINIMKNNNRITQKEFKLNPSKIIAVLDIPEEEITLYKMVNNRQHKTFEEDTSYSELVVPFIKKKHVAKTIILEDASWMLINGVGYAHDYLFEQYPVFKTIDNYLNNHCIDWYSCMESDLAPLYDFLMCIDNISETNEFSAKVKGKLRKKVGRLLIKMEDALDRDSDWYDSDVSEELGKLSSIVGIFDYLHKELMSEETKRVLKVC